MQKRDGHEHETDDNQADAETESTETESTQHAGPAALVAGANESAAIIPKDIDQAWRLATIVGDAGMAPKSYNDKDGNPDKNKILVGIMCGLEVGMPPLMALQSIAVINGVPAIWGDGLLALVKSSGLLVDINESMKWSQDGKTPVSATCVAIRSDTPTPIERTFTMEQAITAELKGKKGPWQQYPARMLAMRARAFALRDGFADVLRGLSVAEEMRDVENLEQGADGVHRVATPSRAEYAEAVKESGLTDKQAAEGNAALDDQFAGTMGGAEAPAQSTESPTSAQKDTPACDPVLALSEMPHKAELIAWRNDMLDSIGGAPSLAALDQLLEDHRTAVQFFYDKYPGTDKTNMLDAIAEARAELSAPPE